MALYLEQAPAEKLEPRLTSAVGEVVRKQVEAGIDVVNDGEYGKPMTDEVDYGAWATYVHGRVSGFEIRGSAQGLQHPEFVHGRQQRSQGFRGLLQYAGSLRWAIVPS